MFLAQWLARLSDIAGIVADRNSKPIRETLGIRGVFLSLGNF
jgi:hypothetical protein